MVILYFLEPICICCLAVYIMHFCIYEPLNSKKSDHVCDKYTVLSAVLTGYFLFSEKVLQPKKNKNAPGISCELHCNHKPSCHNSKGELTYH